MKIVWHPSFSIHKNFYWKTLIYVLSVAVLELKQKLSICDSPENLKFLLTSPL